MVQNFRRYRSQLMPGGYRTQAGFGVPYMNPGDTYDRAPGTQTAVVLKVYYVDDRSEQPEALAVLNNPRINPNNELQPAQDYDSSRMMADVLVYSPQKEFHGRPLHRVPVALGYQSMQDGDLIALRECSISLTGDVLQAGAGVYNFRPHEVDGDHVLITYLDNDPMRPVITGTFKPLWANRGTQDRPGARSTDVKRSERRPRGMKHNGCAIWVDGDGNINIDASRSHKGTFDQNGNETRLPTDPATTGDAITQLDGTTGNVSIKLRGGTTFDVSVIPDPNAPTENVTRLSIIDGQVRIGASGGQTMTLTQSAADSVLELGQIGDAKVHLPIYEHLKELYDTLQSELETLRQQLLLHTHILTPPVATAAPSLELAPLTAPFVSWDTGIQSDRILIPDET